MLHTQCPNCMHKMGYTIIKLCADDTDPLYFNDKGSVDGDFLVRNVSQYDRGSLSNITQWQPLA